MNGPDSQLIITRSTGAKVAAWFDADDFDIIATRHWYLSAGYVTTALPRTSTGYSPALSLHRLILGLGPGDAGIGDHIDGDTLNNRRSNLRVTEQALNCANRAIVTGSGASRFRGVYWRKEAPHWRAKFARTHLGYYETEAEAAAALTAFRRDNGLLGY